ncbi:hypothetical protein BDZ91DRAFT_733616 [Kalaharituber pfeilii]|nr:hypothetical protein BDZ91DRAFT_733616 [Kalaharituber pfeilii]
MATSEIFQIKYLIWCTTQNLFRLSSTQFHSQITQLTASHLTASSILFLFSKRLKFSRKSFAC